MIDRIARQTEAYLWKQNAYGNVRKSSRTKVLSIWDAMANAMARMSHDLRVNSVVVISQSGVTAATMSSARPSAPILAITRDPGVCRRMALLWGVIPILSDMAGSKNPNDLARDIARGQNLTSPGDRILLIRGFHSEAERNTPSITALTM